MSTATPAPSPTYPVQVSIQGGTLNEVMTILQEGLSVLAAVPATAVPASLANVILSIVTAAVQRIESQTGKPIDLTQIPVETPLP
jgi:hypothetical protein